MSSLARKQALKSVTSLIFNLKRCFQHLLSVDEVRDSCRSFNQEPVKLLVPCGFIFSTEDNFGLCLNSNGGHTMRNWLTFLFISALVLCLSDISSADLINGGFETGNLSGWQSLGDVSVQTGSIGSGPVEGSYQAVLTNDFYAYYSGETEYNGQTAWVYPYSGTPAMSPQENYDAFFGLPEGSLDTITVGVHEVNLDDNPDNWSGIKQSFYANAGDTLTFDWNYLTCDGLNYDFAFVSIVSGNMIFTQKLIGNVTLELWPYDLNSSLVSSDTSFSKETGFNSFSFLIPQSEEYAIGIGVFQVQNDLGDSGIIIDNFSVTPVPAPSTVFLLASGFAGLSLIKRKIAI